MSTATVESLLSIKEVLSRLGRSHKWLYVQLRNDSTFPRPLKMSPHSVAFRASEIQRWIDERPRAQLDGLSAIERRQLGGVNVSAEHAS